MQLLEITATPVRYELRVEHAKLEYRRQPLPTARVERTHAGLELHTQKTQVRLDTYQARRSLGAERIGDRLRECAQKGLEHIRQKTREAVEMGQAMSQIHDGVTIGQIVRQKLSACPDAPVTVFLPSGGADISWVPGHLETRYHPGETHCEWHQEETPARYTPGGVRLVVLERPGVEIQYVGQPIYFPPEQGG